MKVTFIQPYYHNVWEALGIGYLISYLKEYTTKEVDINFFQGNFDHTEDIIKGSLDSDIVFFSCTSPAYRHGLYMANRIRIVNPKARIVFGGWHATAIPYDVIREECVDQVVTGEGEQAVVDIVNGNRSTLVQGGVMRTVDLPWPDRQAIKNDRTISLCKTMNDKRTASFQLNRGCKVHCKFCSEVKMTGKYNRESNPIRTRAYHDLLDEIMCVDLEYNLDYFKFVDATFDKNIDTVKDFCYYKDSRGDRLKWECNIHPGFVQDESVFEYLAMADCDQINVGVESGSPKILNAIGKGTSVESIKNVFKWAEKYNIKRRAFFLIGMPQENQQDLRMTEELIDEIEPDVVGFTLLAPYPGTDYYNSSFYRDVDWSRVDEYSNDIWDTAYTNHQLKLIQKYFTDKYSHLLCERQA